METAIIAREPDGARLGSSFEVKGPPSKVVSAKSRRGRGSKTGAWTAKDLRLLRRSFSSVESHAGIAGLIFYRNLFTLDPSLRSLFHTSIELQGRKLMEALNYTLATLEKPHLLVPVLEGMGRRHVGYGARDHHYDTVIEALMRTLNEVLQDGFSPEVRRAWRRALEFVAEAMKRGARQTMALKRESAPSA